jgi:hypothetical protein
MDDISLLQCRVGWREVGGGGMWGTSTKSITPATASTFHIVSPARHINFSKPILFNHWKKMFKNSNSSSLILPWNAFLSGIDFEANHAVGRILSNRAKTKKSHEQIFLQNMTDVGTNDIFLKF